MSACKLCGGDPEAPVFARWEFILPVQPPSQNTIAYNKGPARWRYAKLRTIFEQYIRLEVMKQRIPRAMNKRRVTLTRYYTGRGKERDRGNLIGGMKPLLDALVRQGVLVDDREDFAEDYYHQKQHDVISGVAVCIEELVPEAKENGRG